MLKPSAACVHANIQREKLPCLFVSVAVQHRSRSAAKASELHRFIVFIQAQDKMHKQWRQMEKDVMIDVIHSGCDHPVKH